MENACSLLVACLSSISGVSFCAKGSGVALHLWLVRGRPLHASSIFNDSGVLTHKYLIRFSISICSNWSCFVVFFPLNFIDFEESSQVGILGKH